MPRYYFHIRDDRDILDLDGVDLVDEASARIEAIRLAGEVIHDEAKRVVRCETWHMDVTDAAGQVVFCIDFRTTATGGASSRTGVL